MLNKSTPPTTPTISILNYLDLSSIAYNKLFERHLEKIIPTGYKLLFYFDKMVNTPPSLGYKGIAIINSMTKHIIITNAVVGNKIDEGFEVIGNSDILNGKLPKQYENLNLFLLKVIEKIGGMDKVKDHTFTCTGHSFGALLSELAVAEWHKKLTINAVVFDSPGSKTIIKNNEQWGEKAANNIYEDDLVIIHNASPNVINTLNPQVGKVYQVKKHTKEDLWHNYAFELMYIAVKWVGKYIFKTDKKDIKVPGLEISTHKLNNFYEEIDSKTGKFFEEQEMPKWNSHYTRAPLINTMESSQIYKLWFDSTNEDLKEVKKVTSEIIDLFKQFEFLPMVQDYLCHNVDDIFCLHQPSDNNKGHDSL